MQRKNDQVQGCKGVKGITGEHNWVHGGQREGKGVQEDQQEQPSTGRDSTPHSLTDLPTYRLTGLLRRRG